MSEIDKAKTSLAASRNEQESYTPNTDGFSIDEICDNLSKAFKETDALTLNTIIDMYASQLCAEKDTEAAYKFLETLYDELMAAKEELLNEIGWDLPKILLQFIQLSFLNLEEGLAKGKLVPLIMGCFNELTCRGNSKELFLMACELTSQLDIEEEEEKNTGFGGCDRRTNTAIDRSPIECIVEIKFHILSEVINSCWKTVTTQTPSRFLSMAINSYIAFIKNNIRFIHDHVFILRRLYTFCRNYFPPRPEDPSTFDLETENLLQRKLLRYFLTTSLAECLQGPGSSILYFSRFYYNKEILKKEVQLTQMLLKFLDIFERIYNLAISFDIDLQKEFHKLCIEETVSMYKDLANHSSEYILKLPATYDIIKMSNEKEIQMDYRGILILCGYQYHVAKYKYPEGEDFQLSNLIYLFVRIYSLDKVSQTMNYNTVFMQDVVCNMLWYPLFKYSHKENQAELQQLPSSIIQTLYHLILLNIPSARYQIEKVIYSTLLTRVLSVSPEKEVYELAFDTLSSCPFSEVKCIIISIVKDLMSKNIEIENTDPLNEEISKLTITKNDGEALEKPDLKSKTKQPVLPPRTYLRATPIVMDQFYKITIDLIDNIVKAPTAENLSELLSCLSFYARLQKTWKPEYISKIKTKIVKEIVDNKDFKCELPEVEFIKISLNAL